MKTYLECLPCFMNQALKAARLASDTPEVHRELLDFTGQYIPNVNLDKTPAENGEKIYRQIREITGSFDPYKEIKAQSIADALEIYPKVKKMVADSEDKLLTAIRIAIAGNIIDFGINHTFNINDDLERILHQDFAIFDYDDFRQKLSAAKQILYIGDNAGESVFDRLLIEQMNKPTVYAVREMPVINDVIIKDAVNSGLDKVAKIISSGSPAPGVILHLCNADFLEIYKSADLIISKGQGNYEGLSEEKRSIFFLLKAKCPVIAKDLGVAVNDIILKNSLK